MNLVEEKNLSGCCGLYCGLCTRFQSKAPSRCPGCKLLNEDRTFCGVFGCCVRKRDMVTCADCEEYPCQRLLTKLGVQADGSGMDSFISHKPALPNLTRIREAGLEVWLEEQRERRLLLESLLDKYNDGRSMSFYCLATALVPPDLINRAVDEILATGWSNDLDIKGKAKALRASIEGLASKSGIGLKLRRENA